MESMSQLFPSIRVSCVVKGCRHMSRMTGKPAASQVVVRIKGTDLPAMCCYYKTPRIHTQN